MVLTSYWKQLVKVRATSQSTASFTSEILIDDDEPLIIKEILDGYSKGTGFQYLLE